LSPLSFIFNGIVKDTRIWNTSFSHTVFVYINLWESEKLQYRMLTVRVLQ